MRFRIKLLDATILIALIYVRDR